MPALCQGRIVWATVPDPQGGNPKERPLVIVSATSDIADSDTVIAVAISHSATLREPQPLYVALPFHPQGNVGTKLRKPAVAICNWVIELPKDSIREAGGVVPPRVLLEIIEKLPR